MTLEGLPQKNHSCGRHNAARQAESGLAPSPTMDEPDSNADGVKHPVAITKPMLYNNALWPG